MDKKNLVTISILVKDRQKISAEINKILTENGHLIISRLGVNLQRKCIEKCTAMIVVVVEGSPEKIKGLEEELNQTGAVIKINLFTE